MTSVIPCKNHKRTFLGHPLQSLIEFNPLNTPYKFLTYSPTHLSGMQHQELELALDIGKHSQSQRNYEQNLAEMTPEELSAIIDRWEGEKAALAKDITPV